MMMSLAGTCSVLLVLSLTSAAPVQKTPGVSSNVNEVQKEEELQSLLQLADENSARNDVTVHEEHVQHVHEINGKKMEVDTSRKTVSDTKTGQVISDVKQEVSKADDSAQPEVEVKTEVDVPAEGVHETIVQSGNEAEEPTEAEVEQAEEEEVEFSPEAVAEYLYQTGDFNRFYAALAQLVNASIMTEDEAQSYSQMVALEYDRMQMEDYENSILVQRRAPAMLDQYPVAMETPSLYPLPLDSVPQEGYPPVAMETPEDVFGLDREPTPKDLDMDFDPYELLYALWNEAYGTGDARAEALVSELFNKVRDDSDPDDEGQVRDILLDLIANSLSEDELPSQQSLYGWQPIVDVDTAPVLQQPMENALPVQQPMDEEEAEEEDEEAANELMAQNEKRTAEEPTLSNKDSEPASQQQQQQPANQHSADNNHDDDDDDAQPMESSETQEKEKEEKEAEEGEDSQEEKEEKAPTPAPMSAQKRAAETV